MGDGAPAVFLDRDGTIIEDVGYPRDPAEVRLLPGAAEGLRRLDDAGFRLVVVSNQSGVGRGLVSQDDLQRTHARLLELLRYHGVELAGAYYCTHAPWEGCTCRKPSPEALRRASADLGLHLGMSFLVGDKASDIDAGRRAGCRTILLASPGTKPVTADTTLASDWAKVATAILGEEPKPAPPQ